MDQSISTQIQKIYALSVAVDRLVSELEDDSGDREAAVGCVYILVDEIKHLSGMI